MKIFAIYSDRFRGLRDDWFLRTLPGDMEPVLVECPHDSEPAAGLRTPEWRAALDFKLAVVLDVISSHPGELICISDVDVQFFGSIRQILLDALADHDVAAMQEADAGGMNGGFYALRCTPAVSALWEEVMYADKSATDLHDQDALNAFFEDPACAVRRVLLPDTFWPSHRHLVFGEPEPNRILVHHATGCPDKAAELARVAERLSGGRRGGRWPRASE